MDPFAQQIQRIESNDKVQQLVEAFRLIPIDDADARDQLEASLEKILTPAAHKIPETQRKITEFTFEEPNLSYHEIAARPKYRPMKHGIHYLDEDNTLYYNAEIENSDWVDEIVAATRARDAATAAGQNQADRQAAYNAELARQQRINAAIFAEPPRWVLIKRKAFNDTRMEDSLLQYIDKKHTQVDWYSTIITLRETGHKIGYTRDHFKRVLHRFISYFKPEMNQIGQRMGIDELARLLMTSTMPVNEREMIIDEIKKLTRKQSESLRVPMSNLYSLATTYYDDATDGETQCNKILFQGLLNFTTGTTKEQLQKLITYSQLHKIKLDYHDTLETCIISEKSSGSPKTDLKFGQSENVMVFQSTFSPNDALKNAEKTPVNSRNNSRDSSYSRNSSDRRKNQDRDRRTSSDKQSRSDSRDNDYSRQRTPTSYKSSRDEPRYPSRSYSSEISSRDSRHYRPESRNSEYSRSSEYLRKSRARSNSPYQNKTVIPGLNCSPNYKSGENYCQKCFTEGHEEPYCTQYYHWSPIRCQQCNNGFHLANNHD
jgi:hypothetical protein